MNRRVLLLPLLMIAFAGCPDGKPRGDPVPPSPIVTATATVTSALPWVAVAELVAARLDEVTEAVARGDKKAALEAFDKAYFEEYEGEAHNLEVESRKNLDLELFEGKMTSVVIVRETGFSDIKAAIKSGAPSVKVRELADALLAKIRDDARKLDSMH